MNKELTDLGKLTGFGFVICSIALFLVLRIVSLEGNEITALKKSKSNLAAGLLDLHQKDEYVGEVTNESKEKE